MDHLKKALCCIAVFASSSCLIAMESLSDEDKILAALTVGVMDIDITKSKTFRPVRVGINSESPVARTSNTAPLIVGEARAQLLYSALCDASPVESEAWSIQTECSDDSNDDIDRPLSRETQNPNDLEAFQLGITQLGCNSDASPL
jgi:hypothetical protein